LTAVGELTPVSDTRCSSPELELVVNDVIVVQGADHLVLLLDQDRERLAKLPSFA
jgi:hypothetical protein